MGSPIRARTDSPSRHVGVSSAGTAPNRARTEPGSPKKATPAQSPKKATPAHDVESLKALAADLAKEDAKQDMKRAAIAATRQSVLFDFYSGGGASSRREASVKPRSDPPRAIATSVKPRSDPPRAIAPRDNSPTRRVKTLTPRAITRLPDDSDEDFIDEAELIRVQGSNRLPPGRKPPLSLEGETGELDDLFEEIPSSNDLFEEIPSSGQQVEVRPSSTERRPQASGQEVTPEKRRRLAPLAWTSLSDGDVTDSEEEGGVAEVPAGAGDRSQLQQLQRAAAAETKKTLTRLRDEASPATRALMEYIGKFCKMISDGNAGFEIKV